MKEQRLVEDVDGRLVPAPEATARDRYVVCREPVAEAVGSFISGWNRYHEPDTGRFAPNQQRTQLTQVRAVEWLARETQRHGGGGLSEATIIGMFRRTKEGHLRHQTLDLRTADLLLTAVGRQDLFPHEGVPGGDPRLRPQRRSSRICCPRRSLTGVVPGLPY